VRDVIHLFNQKGLAALDPRWAGGRPRRISDEDAQSVVTATISRSHGLAPKHAPPGTAPGTATSWARGAASRLLIEHTIENRRLAGNPDPLAMVCGTD